MAETSYGYAVWRDGGVPTLIRYKNGEVFTFYGSTESWERTPNKDNILVGDGDFVWYDEISEDEAKRVAVQIMKNYKAKNVK